MRSNIIRDRLSRRDATRNGLLKRRIGLLLSSCFLVTLMSFCTVTPVTFKEAPANSLSLSISITHQYTIPNDQKTVLISIVFSQGNISAPLDGNRSIVCNGIKGTVRGIHPDMAMAVSLQPAGDAYRCFYTDEKGTKTPLIIPIPAGALAITSPVAGATVHVTDHPLPPPGATPTPSGSPTPTPALVDAAALVSTLEIHYSLPLLPAKAKTHANIFAVCGGGNTPACGVVGGQSDEATGIYLLTDVNDLSGDTFHNFTPGASGRIELSTWWSWSMAPGGFHAIQIRYDDSVRIPVTWA